MALEPARRNRLVVGVLVVASIGGVRWWREHNAHGPGAGVAVAKGGGAPEGELVMGSLRLRPCDIGRTGVGLSGTVRAFCARVEVPEDWSREGDPKARQISLRVAVVPSRSAQPERDVATFLDGGPGGAAVDDYPGLAGAFHEIRAHRRVLLVDQRGTGGSNELRCDLIRDEEAARQPKDAGSPGAGSDNELDQVRRAALDDSHLDRERLQRSLRACLEKLSPRADPAQYTTTAAVRDLEAVRRALGSPPLDLVGISYGTRMAQQYAGSYPEAVRAVILDSPVPNPLALGSETAINLEEALKSRFARCRATPACAARFGDPYASLYRLRDRLRAHPERVTSRDPVTFAPVETLVGAADLAVTARLFAYHPGTAALLPLTIDEALHGHLVPLLGQRKLITDSVTEQLTDGMGLSVGCADDGDLIVPRPEDRQLILGDSMVEFLRAACEVWPRGRRSEHFHDPWRASVPTLILVGEHDPITPPRYGEEIRRGLANARLLTGRGQGHGLLNIGCTPRLAGDFLGSLDTSLDASCLDALGETPAFLAYSGAAP